MDCEYPLDICSFCSGVWQCCICWAPGLFCWRYRGTLEEGGIGLWGMQSGVEVFVVWMERGTPEEGGIGPGRDYVGGYY